MPKKLRKKEKAKVICFVAFDGMHLLDLVGPLDVFSGANVLMERAGGVAHYQTEVVSPLGQAITASNGAVLDIRKSFKDLKGHSETLIVPGGLDIAGLLEANPEIVQELREKASRFRRICGVCSGTFFLAEAGLLNQKRATTHWAGCEELQRRYPSIRVEPDLIYVREQGISTSAGVTAGIDLALALVEEDLGRKVAMELAKWFVVYLRRPGGQSQFSTQLASQLIESEPIQRLLSWIDNNLAEDLSIELLAEKMHYSPRHFIRIFNKEVGLSPSQYLLKLRLEKAKKQLEETTRGMKEIAGRSGFGSFETLRRNFAVKFGITPGEYRERFGKMGNTVGRISN